MNYSFDETKKAKEVVEQILKKLEISSPPVPIEKVAEFFGVRVLRYPKFPDSVSGALLKDGGLNIIGVNENHPATRQRFTIAHELGHYLLDHDHQAIFDDVFDKPDNKEREANKFAAELLMPREILFEDVDRQEYDIPGLANRYDVSEQAISVRLLETGLINKVRPPKRI